MNNNDYFDMRNLTSPVGPPEYCPVSGCKATLGKADSQWGEMPYCPEHRIRIHAKTQTFVYYNGPDPDSKREAALRNVVFERDYFGTYILGHAGKAETHRICHETSEDALTWNVFSQLAGRGLLPTLLSSLTGLSLKAEPQLYLWGLKIGLHDSIKPNLFPPLDRARKNFEKGIHRYLTEPDIMLYIPGELLALIEAKFTAGNTIALATAKSDVDGEKPRSREGIQKRYTLSEVPSDSLLTPSTSDPFYAQLYRNLVFANHMANELGVPWRLVNLVCERRFDEQQSRVEFQDPTYFIRRLLPDNSRGQFTFYSWERLYNDHVERDAGLQALADYMYNKSAHCIRALRVSCPDNVRL